MGSPVSVEVEKPDRFSPTELFVSAADTDGGMQQRRKTAVKRIERSFFIEYGGAYRRIWAVAAPHLILSGFLILFQSGIA